MASSSKPETLEAGRSSRGKISQKFQNLFQRTEKATFPPKSKLKGNMRVSKHGSPGGAESLALEKISERFQKYIDDIDQPTYYQNLKSIFGFNNGIKITKCICLGLGSFNVLGADGSGTQNHTPEKSLHQLAVLTVILRILSSSHDIQQVYFQDPAFSKVEKTFLQSLGHTVLEDPAAFKKMSTSTLLFAPFLGFDVTVSALAVAFPALYVGNSPAAYLGFLEAHRNNPKDSDEEHQRIIGVLEQFENAVLHKKALPSFEQHVWAKNTTVHWLSPAFVKGSKDKA